MKGYKAAELESKENPTSERSLWTQCQSLAEIKFTYVVSCQQYGIHKRSGNARAKEVLKLMTRFVSEINLITCYCLRKHCPVIFHTNVILADTHLFELLI